MYDVYVSNRCMWSKKYQAKAVCICRRSSKKLDTGGSSNSTTTMGSGSN